MLAISVFNFTVSTLRQAYLQIINAISNVFWLLKQLNRDRLGNVQFYCKDSGRVSNLAHQFRLDGPDKLVFITDFDHTLTRFSDVSGGKKLPSCYSLFSASKIPAMTQELKSTLRQLHDKYYPIEASGLLSSTEKQHIMEEWWSQAHRALASAGLSLDELQQIAEEALMSLPLREGANDLFSMLNELHVPIYIFSGGIGLFIRRCLSNCLESLGDTHLVHIKANEFIFDNSTLVGFSEPVICGKKNGKHLIDDIEKERHNVIVLGDMLGDSSMADGLTNVKAVLKIGLLNQANLRKKEDVRAYTNAFDIVFRDDTTLDGVIRLLRFILGQDENL